MLNRKRKLSNIKQGGTDIMNTPHHKPEIQSIPVSQTRNENKKLPGNLFLDETVPQVNVILVNQNKKKKISIDPNELLMEFHCEV